eukprot:jgi/Bigna1/144092/aug1.84_g18800
MVAYSIGSLVASVLFMEALVLWGGAMPLKPSNTRSIKSHQWSYRNHFGLRPHPQEHRSSARQSVVREQRCSSSHIFTQNPGAAATQCKSTPAEKHRILQNLTHVAERGDDNGLLSILEGLEDNADTEYIISSAITRLIKRKRPDKALRLFRKIMEKYFLSAARSTFLNSYVYAAGMNAAAKSGRWREGIAIFERATYENGRLVQKAARHREGADGAIRVPTTNLNPVLYGVYMECLRRGRKWKESIQTLETLAQTSNANAFHLSTVLQTLLDASRPRMALKIFRDYYTNIMKENSRPSSDSSSPTTSSAFGEGEGVIFLSAIKAYGQINDSRNAVALLLTAVKNHKKSKDAKRGGAGGGSGREGQQAMMADRSIVNLFNAAIYACKNTKEDHAAWETAFRLLHLLEHDLGIKPDEGTYAAAATCCAQGGREGAKKALHLLRTARRKYGGKKEAEQYFSGSLHGAVLGTNLTLSEAERVLYDLKAMLISTGGRPILPHHYTVVMGLSSKFAQWEMALDVLNICGQGAVSSPFLISHAIAACGKAGKPRKALTLYSTFKEAALGRNGYEEEDGLSVSFVFNAVLKASGVNGYWKIILQLLEDAKVKHRRQ